MPIRALSQNPLLNYLAGKRIEVGYFLVVLPNHLNQENKMPKNTYYVTTASNHPNGPGYWEVKASSELQARAATFEALGNKWSFMYDSFADIHILDTKRHGLIVGE